MKNITQNEIKDVIVFMWFIFRTIPQFACTLVRFNFEILMWVVRSIIGAR